MDRRTAAENAALAVVYVLVSSAVSSLGSLPGNIAPIWPATGLALTVLMVRGLRLLPGVALGELVFNLTHHAGLIASVGMSAGNALEATTAVLLLQRCAGPGGRPSLRVSRDVGRLILLAAGLCTWIASIVGVASLLVGGRVSLGDTPRSLMVWWVGDALGVLTVTPLLLAVAAGGLRRRPSVEQAVQLTVGLVLASLVFTSGDDWCYLLYPVVLWSALRLGEAWTTLTGAALAGLTVVATADGHGPFVRTHDVHDLWFLASYLLVMQVTGLVTAAAVAERNDTSTSLTSSVAGLEARVWERTAELLQDQKALSETQRLAGLGSWGYDLATGVVTWSDGMASIFGLDTRNPTFDSYLAMLHPDDVAMVTEAFDTCLRTGRPYEIEHRIVRDGEVRHLVCTGRLTTSAAGDPVSMQGAAQDITVRHQAAQALRESEAQFRLLAEHSTDIICRLDHDSVLRYATPSWVRILGHPLDEMVGLPVIDLVHPEDVATAREVLNGLRVEPGTLTCLVRFRHLDGSWVWIEADAQTVRDARGETMEIQVSLRDVTSRLVAEEALRVSEERLAHQATHDPLTDLANRHLLLERLGASLPHASLLFIDLDHFKEVNDSWGHGAGDEALLLVAERLETCCAAPATVARIGGDEFVVLVPTADTATATALAQTIAEALGEPGQLDGGRLVRLGASVGVTTARATSSAESMLREADSALYHAKHSGRGRVVLFDRLLRDRDVLRGKVESDLRDALDNRRVTVHFQPLVSLDTGRTIGAEALLRLQDAEHRAHLPELLVEVAEGSGIILDVGARVLAESCGVAARWCDPTTFVSVNVSGREILHQDFARGVVATLEATGLAPERLWLELTERTLVDAEKETLRSLRALVDRGVRIGIDDFGTGYSSVTYLRTLPVSFLKIDRSFVAGLDTDQRDTAVVRAVLDLAGSMGIATIGEGVETEGQAMRLAELGCQIGQGFFWARPGPHDVLGLDATGLPRPVTEGALYLP